MARSHDIFHCSSCDATALQWSGRCPQCGDWNTLAGTPRATTAAVSDTHPLAVSLRDVDANEALPSPTGIDEVDRVLNGGFIPGAVTLVFGPPGVGKSTLLFQVLSSVAGGGSDVLLASAEESLAQVSTRANRLGPIAEHLLVLEGNDVGAIEAAVIRQAPTLVVVDSIQAICDPLVQGSTGSLIQIRQCVDRLTRLAKSTGIPIVLVGHVTKKDDLAGPRTIEHMVDTVLSFDGDRHHSLRMLTAVKHRFGPTGEVGIFEMRDDGLRSVPDPGSLLLGDRVHGIPGSIVVPTLQGRRPLLVEVQALLGPCGVPGTYPKPRTRGIDTTRVNLLVAVLATLPALLNSGGELFVGAVGGISISEPAADLAVALAIVSAATGFAVPPDLTAFGEIGLAGEIRSVPGCERRLAEAARAGFTRALVPASTPIESFPASATLEVIPVRSVRRALLHTVPQERRDAWREVAHRQAQEDQSESTMARWSTVAASR